MEVESLEPGAHSGFLLRTSAGELRAERAVVCTGAYQRAHRPPAAAFPPGVPVIDAARYRNPAALPPGKILVIGSGQTGCQIAEELCEAGREVFLSCGRAPWLPRRLDGCDIVTWLSRTTFFDTPLAALPSPAERLVANLQATGRGGGHDLHYRTLQAIGVQLVGRLAGVDGHRARFAGDLADSVAFGDARYAAVKRLLAEQLTGHGRPAPVLPDPPPFRADPLLARDLRGVAAVIFTSGFPRTTRAGCAFRPSTPPDSRSPPTGAARWSPGCGFAESTSCARASRHCCSGWARTHPPWRGRSPPTDPHRPAGAIAPVPRAGTAGGPRRTIRSASRPSSLRRRAG